MIELERLRKRKLVQWAIAYLAAAWLILQLVDLLADTYPAAAAIPRIVLPLLAIGFLAALVVAWYHGEKGSQRVGGMEIMMLAGILVIAGAAVGFLARTGGRAADAEVAPVAGMPSGVAAEQNSIAVLPFVNMSGDAKQEYFADGLTEELLNVLAQLPELRVASRTSAFAFKGREVGIDSIAKALRVAHVLEGSVRQAGQRVKITAQLIDATSGYHLWSDTYERDYQDIFAIQEEISRAIVDALKLRLSDGRADSALSVPETADPEAHRLVLEGMAALRVQNQASLRHAVDCLRQAVARDPDYVPAGEQLAGALFTLAYRGMVPAAAQGYEAARREAERVLALDPGNANANVTLGDVADLYDWDFAKAQEHYRRALERNPNSAMAHASLGTILVRVGQPERALTEVRRAVEVDPLSPAMQNRLGAISIYARRSEEGIAAFRSALALSPDATTALGNLALSYAATGMLAEALPLAERAVAVDSADTFTLSVLGYVYGIAGRRADAERMLRRLEALPGAALMDRASINMALGRTDAVFKLLEQALAVREPYLVDLPVDPMYDPVRDDPRMKRLVARIGPR